MIKCEQCDNMSDATAWIVTELEQDPDDCTCGYHNGYLCPVCHYPVDSVHDGKQYIKIQKQRDNEKTTPTL